MTGPRNAFGSLVCSVAVALAAAGCSSDHPFAADEDATANEGEAAEAGYTIPDYWKSMVAPEDRGTRYDAPWWYLTDEDLMDAVAAANGRVSIGFKDPDERGGVDNDGKVLASPESVAIGKDFLRGFGITFEIEFQLIPAVSATISPDLVPTIREHPRVDYISARLPGERAG